MQLPTDFLAALDALSGDWHGAGCLEMANLEALRAGTHPVFGFGNLGNYSGVRAMEKKK